MTAHLRDGMRLPARFTILGAARSGLAAARYLVQHGYSVFISDTCDPQKLDFVLAGNDLAHIPHEGGEHTEQVLDTDVIIASPGIARGTEILSLARRRGIPVWSEIELGYRISTASLWAVTGSTGKSTTATMAGAIAREAGLHSEVCGNIGVALSAVAWQLPPTGVAVVEVSSFQLEAIDTFRPRIALITNLMKNHLDRHRNEHEYWNLKKGIARRMDSTDHLVLNATDPHLREWGREQASRVGVVWYGATIEGEPCVWCRDGVMVSTIHCPQGEEILAVSEMMVEGRHNHENACGAAAMGICAGIGIGSVAAGLRSVQGLPHRLAFVGKKRGVRWYNDSKSTTAESVLAAAGAFDRAVRLIAGGRDKGCDFGAIARQLGENAVEVLLIGEAAPRMAAAWKKHVPVVRCRSLDEAVQYAARVSQEGDIVVLSPGCSSFDMFSGYEERGERFAGLVAALAD